MLDLGATPEELAVEDYEFSDILCIIEAHEKRGGWRNCSNDSCWRCMGRTVRARVLMGVVTLHVMWLVSYGVAQIQDAYRPGQCEDPDPSREQEPCDALQSVYIQKKAQYDAHNVCLVAPPLHGNLGSCAEITNTSGGGVGAGGVVMHPVHGLLATLPAGASCRLACDGSGKKHSGWELDEAEPRSGDGMLTCGDSSGRPGELSLGPKFCGAAYPTCVDRTCKTQRMQLFYAWVLILMAVYLLALSMDWLLHENEYASFAFLVVVTFLVLRTLYVPLSGGTEFGSEPGMLPGLHAAVTTLLGLFYYYMVWFVDKEFGLFIYRIVKTSIELREAYWTHAICQTALKIDGMFQGLIIATSFTFWNFTGTEVTDNPTF